MGCDLGAQGHCIALKGKKNICSLRNISLSNKDNNSIPTPN